ncbi:hypothetical protein [Streptomyces sp. NPDC052042]|uniref:hypothetical protein n=1 Tax=Streptomyces sp. NPDC052042 TaxID=3365683 RepID=UPI0037D3555F
MSSTHRRISPAWLPEAVASATAATASGVGPPSRKSRVNGQDGCPAARRQRLLPSRRPRCRPGRSLRSLSPARPPSLCPPPRRAASASGRTPADVAEWALETKLRSPRLHRHGKDGDALVVLTGTALAELGLPPMGGDEKKDFVQRLGLLPKTHKAVKQIEKARRLLTQRGLDPWARTYHTPKDGKRQCLQLCIPTWGALSSGGWKIPDGLNAPGLARLLGTYATRMLTPHGSTAVSGLEPVATLRPPTRALDLGLSHQGRRLGMGKVNSVKRRFPSSLTPARIVPPNTPPLHLVPGRSYGAVRWSSVRSAACSPDRSAP